MSITGFRNNHMRCDAGDTSIKLSLCRSAYIGAVCTCEVVEKMLFYFWGLSDNGGKYVHYQWRSLSAEAKR